MTKYRGNVEAARQQLLATGSTPKDAKRHAPRLAEIREAQEDSRTRPNGAQQDALYETFRHIEAAQLSLQQAVDGRHTNSSRAGAR